MSTPPPGSGLRGSRVLVTGAGGFVGRRVVERLTTLGADVVPLTRAECDLSDEAAVTRVVVDAAPDAVLHLSAARRKATTAERRETTAVNALSGAWVAAAVPETCRVVVRLGSSTEYAGRATPMDETTPLEPRGYFGKTKAAGGLLLDAEATRRGIRAVHLRAFQVYGPGDHPTRFVPTLVRAAAEGAPLPLTGPGRCRDWVWVDDVVDACLLAAQSTACTIPAGTVLNIGTGRQTSNEDLVRTFTQVTGIEVDTRPGAEAEREWDTTSWVCDPRRARELLGWSASTPLADGLATCWEQR